MNASKPATTRILGTLHVSDGVGIVRIEDRLDSGIDTVWSALTDPSHLTHWLGDLKGDLRQGGEIHARYHASGWEGTLRVEVCEPPRRLLLLTSSPDDPGGTVEVTLTEANGQTLVVFEDRGVPIEYISAYGAGNQIHLEDLTAHLAGRDRCDAQARWRELDPFYQAEAEVLTPE